MLRDDERFFFHHVVQSDFIFAFSATPLSTEQNSRQEVVGNMPSLITKTMAWKPQKKPRIRRSVRFDFPLVMQLIVGKMLAFEVSIFVGM